MTPTDLETLRGLVELAAKTTGTEWHTGCMCDPESTCSCRSILTDNCFGSVCQITKRIDLPIGEGGNDAPPEAEAIANAQFIAASRNAIPALTDLLADYERMREWIWINHGCGFAALYGDDGEMSCGNCLLDFKRMPVSECLDRMKAKNEDALRATLKGE